MSYNLLLDKLTRLVVPMLQSIYNRASFRRALPESSEERKASRAVALLTAFYGMCLTLRQIDPLAQYWQRTICLWSSGVDVEVSARSLVIFETAHKPYAQQS